MHMKTPELEARWLRILETIAAPNKVTVWAQMEDLWIAKISFVGGFEISAVHESALAVIAFLLSKISSCHLVELSEYETLQRVVAVAYGKPSDWPRYVHLTDETQIVIGEKRFAGSNPYEAALYAFEASEFWRGVEKSAKFARYQAKKLRG